MAVVWRRLIGRRSSLVCWREALLLSGILQWSSVHRDSEVVYRSSFIVTIIFMIITAAVLAEVCSALPLSGSIYIWAAESAGPKYARFFGFIVAWWSCTAWMSFTAGNSQVSVCASLSISSHSYSLISDGCKLYRFTACCLGDQLSRRGF